MASTLEQAQAAAKQSPQQAVELYNSVLFAQQSDSVSLVDRETALLALAALFERMQDAAALTTLINNSQSFLIAVSKAKSSKLIRTLVDRFNGIPGALQAQINTCKGMLEWARNENREYLRQSLETRLVSLYLDSQMYTEALSLISQLLSELKKLDDRMQLVEVHLLESRVFLALKNLPKSRAALTSARTAANSIYTPPPLQAQLDLQSGTLHSEEGDFETAYSYFFETMEGLNVYANSRAANAGSSSVVDYEQRQLQAFSYMIMCKIMTQQPDDITALFATGKTASKFRDRQVVVALQTVAKAQKQRSLADFEKAMSTFRNELQSDELIHTHLTALYDTLMEQNLVRLIEPYSRVEIAHVAKLIGLPIGMVENKLSQMILDKVFYGILDQGNGCLVVFPEPRHDSTYETTLDTIKSLGNVVESLYTKAAAFYSHAAYVLGNKWNCMPDCVQPETIGTVVDYTWHHNAPASVGYVAHNDYTRIIVVAFRGSADAEDWVQDSEFAFDPWPPHLPGSMVHHGFLSAYQSVAPNVTNIVAQLAARYPSYKMVFTGHSLGGAETVLCAVDMLSQHPELKHRMYIYTYGMPRIGNEVWASSIEALDMPIYRVVYENDLVPHIPFQWLGYMHFSQEVWIHNNQTMLCGKEHEALRCSESVAVGSYSVPDHSQYSLANWKFTV
ncbi:26S proteasome regulatory subunit rpn6 [Coemansia sp. RSA 989]|nr:26S proteasome regulatory subunit rpn6 [Coemansia sp. RSA 1821]KAJ1864696.1 26S proteasome regulatory subunit rpn6 [Coemansia sp. RSA 989]KAJ1872193.1 26S proteasome regulatory subunit rpn6 [Coemansia sp. RSA 990]KAJ2674536.1 26S proteasome regulatory subunit rpn6 [Coemansia sp. RSA 1085]